ncbi:hypothetical protein LZ198_27535 [Myxococcus sp. K15C18031901]|uniref:hypothetical protein n=1 Tax=Myxococcus dinghuensis TaxID=2906761 RepID=UPI0020A73D04|nr:hypothetical protein [Myxococcus dinghuensis]MCP3102633.1 hypothetical protein [Myxococcus dinghuensis]
MGRFVFAVVLLGLGGCGGEGETQRSFSEWSERASATMCAYAERCEGATTPHEDCVVALLDAYAALERDLDDGLDGAKSGCVRCMRTRTEALDVALASGCEQAPDVARIDAACGVDNSACAGVP